MAESRLGVLTAVVAALVVLVVTPLAWQRSPDPVTAEEAAELARDALAAADIPDASVGTEPSAGDYESEASDAVAVWQTVATVEGGTIRLWLSQEDGEPVFLDDRGPSGATQLLTDAQFEVLADVDENPARDRLLHQNRAATVAAAAALVAAAMLGTVGARRRH